MRGKFLLLTTIISCHCFIATAQIYWNQTYPLLSNEGATPLFTQEVPNQLLMTGCLEDEWTQLQLNPDTGELQRNIEQTTNNCQSIQLADGQTLSFEKNGDQYEFTQYRGSSVVWTKSFVGITADLTAQQVVAHPTSGFYICEPYPFRLTRYNMQGEAIYTQEGLTPVGYNAQIGTVVANGDVLLHLGHVAAHNRSVIITRLAGLDGRVLWETEIETADRVNRDTRVAAALDYPTIAIANHFVENAGWEAIFLDAQTGRFINKETIFSYAERSIIPNVAANKGIFLTESYSLDNQLVNNYITLHRYNENGNIFWRKPLLDSQLDQARVISQIHTLPSKDLLLTGVRNDSLWLLRFNPTGDLSESLNGEIDAPDLVLKISADRPDLPLYDFLTFTLIVRNEGGVAAEDIRINAPFVDYQTLTAAGEESVTHGVFYNWTGNWDIERLDPGEEAVLTMKTFVLSNQPTFRYFSVFEQSPADFDHANNSILLNLPYTGILAEDTEELRRPTIYNTDWSARSTAQTLQIKLENVTGGQTDLVLFDLNGRLIKKQRVQLFVGQQQLELQLGDLPKGMYVLRRMDTGEATKIMF